MTEWDIGPVAAFDFDGTLSRRDTLIPFLAAVRGRRRVAVALARALARPMAGDRNRVKAAVLRRLLAGLPADKFTRQAETYGRSLTGRLRPDTVARLAEHRDLGHRVVIVSASLRDYLEPVADRLGAELVCTELEVGADGRLTGELAGTNVRGPEKPRRLLEHLGGEPTELWSYGNSSGDRELLAVADHPVWVRSGRLDPVTR